MLNNYRIPELSAAVAVTDVIAAVDLSNLDAVYLGQPYCLRVKGNLLTDVSALKAAVARLRDAGKRAYITTPIVPKDRDFKKIKAVLDTAAAAAVDAVEVHDVGVFRWCKREYPQLSLHISSLANIYQPETAAFYRDEKVGRIIPANELLLEEIVFIKEQVDGVEFGMPVHGRLPLGMSYACMLRLRFPGRELTACRQQCAEEHYMVVDDWRMRCVGTAMVTGDDFSIIEQLPQAAAAGFAGWRLETHFDDADKINSLAEIYRQAVNAIDGGGIYPGRELAARLRRLCGGLCNGWRFGLSGRDYADADRS